MDDSQRSAALAKEVDLDVGLHLNFTQEMTQLDLASSFVDCHTSIRRYLTKNNRNFLIYNPALKKPFEYVFKVQIDDFHRLYGKLPSHIDGHHHMHLCINMLIGNIIPKGQKLRRNFTFARGEKSFSKRLYRAIIDTWVTRHYLTTDYFFSLGECIRLCRLEKVLNLSNVSTVEIETHPEHDEEFEWLMGDHCLEAFSIHKRGTYAQL